MATSTAAADRPTSQHSGSPAEASTESGRSPVTGHTPFLQNLSQRFRRGSNVSSNTSDSQGQHADKSDSGHVPAQTPKQQQRARADAARAAKRYLMTIVRNDWEFSPETPPQQQNLHPESREPTSWRLRNDGSEDELDHANPTSPPKRRSKVDPYRFENPDAIADYVRERQVKRRKVLHEQMEWNVGLRNWVLERDAWTGAVWKEPNSANGAVHTGGATEASNGFGIVLEKGDIPDSGTTTTRTTATASPTTSEPDQHASSHFPPSADIATTEASPAGTSVDSLDPAASTTTNTTSSHAPATTPAYLPPPSPSAPGPYIPVYAPLFPEDNVLRSRIQPSTYGTIYSKVVVQSLTPNIPIPLPDMVRSLVAGWKEEGQWPPSGNAGDGPGIAGGSKGRAGGGGGTGKRDSGGAFGRWRREKERKAREERRGSVGALIAGEGDSGGGHRHGHRVRRSISSVVKRVIGLEDPEGRRESEVGLGLGFEEDDEVGEGEGAEEGGGGGVREGAGAGADGDERLNRGLLVEQGKA